MNAKTLKALMGSIHKWEQIAAGLLIDDGQNNCPLCSLFFHNRNCAGCPVAEKTGCGECENSPYQNEWVPLFAHDDEKRVTCPDTRAAAKSELSFLIGLLPKERK